MSLVLLFIYGYGDIAIYVLGVMKNKMSLLIQIKIFTEKTNDIYTHGRSFKLNLVNHISLMFD